MVPNSKPDVLVIVGPTASGKTELAIELAERLPAEIISADSRYFYRSLKIGVSKPTPEERSRAVHHLIDTTDLGEPWSLARFQEEVARLIPQIGAKGRLPIITGGTGQYLRAILQGWRGPGLEADEALRTEIERWGEAVGSEALLEKLGRVDPAAVEKMDHRNVRRTIRAWEVILRSGRRFSEQRKRGESPYNVLTVGLDWPREVLYERIDWRIQRMLDDGLIEEVEDLILSGRREYIERMGIIGYNEILGYLDGESSLEEAVSLIKRNTRIYVRRQANWFKPTDPEIIWLNAQDPGLVQKILDLVEVKFGVKGSPAR